MKIYLLGHTVHRLKSDFASVTAGSPRCDLCDISIGEHSPPLRFYWDFEFGVPQRAFDDNHDFYWGSFQLIVTDRGRQRVEQARLNLAFVDIELVETSLSQDELVVTPCASQPTGLHWARPVQSVAAVANESNRICSKCNKFIDTPRQLTRLIVRHDSVTHDELFSIRQNRGEPMFATETLKNRLSEMGLRGIGFYPAGRLV